MNETITITTKGIADALGEYLFRLGNFDSSEIRPTKIVSPRIFNPDIFELMLASESVLARDWDTPEEDEAWSDL